MATQIETLKKQNGDKIVPRTLAKAVFMSNGKNLQDTLEDTKADLLNELGEKVLDMFAMDELMFEKFGRGEKDYFFSQANWDLLQAFNRAYVQAYDEENDLRVDDSGKGQYALRAISRFGKGTNPRYPWMKKTDWPILLGGICQIQNYMASSYEDRVKKLIFVDELPNWSQDIDNNEQSIVRFYCIKSNFEVYVFNSSYWSEPSYAGRLVSADDPEDEYETRVVCGIDQDEDISSIPEKYIIRNDPPTDDDFPLMATIIERRPDGHVRLPDSFEGISEENKGYLAVTKNYVDKKVGVIEQSLDYPKGAVTFDQFAGMTEIGNTTLSANVITIKRTVGAGIDADCGIIQDIKGNYYLTTNKKTVVDREQVYLDITKQPTDDKTLLFQTKMRFVDYTKALEIRLYKDANNRAFSQFINWKADKKAYLGNIPLAIYNNEWFVLAVEYDGTKGRMYINGNLVAEVGAPSQGAESTVGNTLNVRLLTEVKTTGRFDLDDVVFGTMDYVPVEKELKELDEQIEQNASDIQTLFDEKKDKEKAPWGAITFDSLEEGDFTTLSQNGMTISYWQNTDTSIESKTSIQVDDSQNKYLQLFIKEGESSNYPSLDFLNTDNPRTHILFYAKMTIAEAQTHQNFELRIYHKDASGKRPYRKYFRVDTKDEVLFGDTSSFRESGAKLNETFTLKVIGHIEGQVLKTTTYINEVKYEYANDIPWSDPSTSDLAIRLIPSIGFYGTISLDDVLFELNDDGEIPTIESKVAELENKISDVEESDAQINEVLDRIIEIQNELITGTLEYEKATSYNGDPCYIVKGIGTYKSSDIVIPDTYKGIVVSEIAEDAFRGNTKLTSAVIGKNILTVGKCAFEGCSNLTSIQLTRERLVYDMGDGGMVEECYGQTDTALFSRLASDSNPATVANLWTITQNEAEGYEDFDIYTTDAWYWAAFPY